MWILSRVFSFLAYPMIFLNLKEDHFFLLRKKEFALVFLRGKPGDIYTFS